MAGYEHALFLILLLGFLLIGLRDRHQFSLYILIGGVLLTLLPPFFRIKIPWEFLLALILPWILSQGAQNSLQISWKFPMREFYLWLLATLCLGLIVYFVGGLFWLRAVYMGIVAASMFWNLSRSGETYSLLEVFGPLTLVFLLVETSLPLNEPTLYFGTLFSGAGIGIFLAILAIAIMKKMPVVHFRWVLLIQAYVTYWVAYLLKTSPIAAVLIGVVVFIEFYLFHPEDKETTIVPTKLDNRVPFYVLLGIFVFTAWQTHQPMALVQWAEVALGLLACLLIALLGQRIGVSRFEHLITNWRNALKLCLFLFGFLLLWPQGSEINPGIIWIALGMAILLPVISANLLAVLRDLSTEKHVNYPDEL